MPSEPSESQGDNVVMSVEFDIEEKREALELSTQGERTLATSISAQLLL